MRKAVSVLKKRSGGHEPTIRELRLDEGRGVRIGPALSEFRGVLTGVPVYTGVGRTDPRRVRCRCRLSSPPRQRAAGAC